MESVSRVDAKKREEKNEWRRASPVVMPSSMGASSLYSFPTARATFYLVPFSFLSRGPCAMSCRHRRHGEKNGKSTARARKERDGGSLLQKKSCDVARAELEREREKKKKKLSFAALVFFFFNPCSLASPFRPTPSQPTQDPLFAPNAVHGLSLSANRDLTLERLLRYVRRGQFFSVRDYGRDPRRFMAGLESLALVDYSLCIKAGVHFTLCVVRFLFGDGFGGSASWGTCPFLSPSALDPFSLTSTRRAPEKNNNQQPAAEEPSSSSERPATTTPCSTAWTRSTSPGASR